MHTKSVVRRLLVLLPRLADGRYILLRRAGESAGSGLWELPACLLPEDADLTAAAADLMHKTTDYVPGRLTRLGMVGSEAEACCLLAEDLRPSHLPPVEAGRAMVSPVHPEELERMIRLGAVRCGTLLAAVRLLGDADGRE